MAMPDRWPIPEDLLRDEARRISSRYRVDAGEALDALAEAFAARPDVARRVCERKGHEDVTRWRDYRDVVKRCRKELYYELRRYYRSSAEFDRLVQELEMVPEDAAAPERVAELRQALLNGHASTRERMPHYAAFYEEFFKLVGVPTALLDLGCGMHPLSYPFDGAGAATDCYVALDKDYRAVRGLLAYAQVAAPERLLPMQASLDRPDWAARLPRRGPFEVAVMLKVVPVLNRLDKAAVERLQDTPAERILLTGNVESMTRRENVERRERGVLRSFIEQSGRQVVGEFRAGSELGFLVE
ncbi:MAG: class I SAM-dependent methyltransferase [Planctomycetota bacterium]|jgi:16S rRNA (guanine(1405)-N(7))-methyltransferase